MPLLFSYILLYAGWQYRGRDFIFHERFTQRENKQAEVEYILQRQQFVQSTQHAEAVQSIGFASSLITRWLDGQLKILLTYERIFEKSMLLSAFSKFIRLLMQMLVLGIGSYLVIHQELSAVGMIVASILTAKGLFQAGKISSVL